MNIRLQRPIPMAMLVVCNVEGLVNRKDAVSTFTKQKGGWYHSGMMNCLIFFFGWQQIDDILQNPSQSLKAKPTTPFSRRGRTQSHPAQLGYSAQ